MIDYQASPDFTLHTEDKLTTKGLNTTSTVSLFYAGFCRSSPKRNLVVVLHSEFRSFEGRTLSFDFARDCMYVIGLALSVWYGDCRGMKTKETPFNHVRAWQRRIFFAGSHLAKFVVL